VSIYLSTGTDDDLLSYLLQEDWDIFSDGIEQSGLTQQLTVAILKAGLNPKEYYSCDYPDYTDYFCRKGEWLVEYWHDMAENYFLSGKKDTDDICPLTVHYDKDWPIDDLPTYLEIAFEDLSTIYEPEHIIYRARIHDNRTRNQWFDFSEVVAPPPDKTPAGRVNRRNDPVLYLANTADTALSEVRAWKGMAVAIATFNPDFPLANLSVYVAPRGKPEALVHNPQNQARFLRGTDNSR
jgi:hypothetical protein